MSRARNQGFSLIEIMAVVVIIGLLVALVGVNVTGQMDTARVKTAAAQIDRLEGALEFYRMDNANYPTSEQGLEALVVRPTSPPEPRRYQPDGYLKRSSLPVDPWGEPYHYLAPGQHNPRGFDLWSYGADRQPGGSENGSDIGNWDS
ncbi:MAG: type II secretion system major pseudopilin GspG [Deltaproteobacteria bacterium]|nr:type II secretion system major pseudopilin GspG [Deltaproteobacteria bacterium]